MNPTKTILILIVLSLFLAACSKTVVVKLDDSSPTKVETKSSETKAAPVTQNKTQTPASSSGSQIIDESGKKVVKCVDTDGEDVYTGGMVTVTYDDGSKKEFYDECTVPNENFVTEYICDSGSLKTKMGICKELCVIGVCI